MAPAWHRARDTLPHFSEDRIRGDAGATVSALLNLGTERFEFHRSELFPIFQRAQSVANDLARACVSTLLNLILDEGFEVRTDDIA